eukprot:8980310-Pyramimonas_sp.AAC.1
MAQDSGRWVKIASDTRPKGLKTAPRRFQVLPEASEDPPNSLKMAPRRSNIALRGVQQGPMTAPREPKSAPRAGQEGPWTAFLSLR